MPRRAFTGNVGVLAGGTYELEVARSVGEGGMMFSTGRALEPGDRVIVNFHLEGSLALIVVKAVVRNFTPPRTSAQGREPAWAGVEFLDLSFQHRREIRNFVAQATESML